MMMMLLNGRYLMIISMVGGLLLMAPPPCRRRKTVMMSKKKRPKTFERKGFGAAPRCPCGSGQTLDLCCDRVRRDPSTATPEEIVRSRYTAYSRGDWEYLMATTSKNNSAYKEDKKAWLAELRDQPFSDYRFLGAEILEASVSPETEEATVLFTAKLKDKDTGSRADFTERSYFNKDDTRGWLYLGGDVSTNSLINLNTGESEDGGDFGLEQQDALQDVQKTSSSPPAAAAS